jgi:histidinol phosphatase-like PHP family hydrolase
MIKPIYNLHLHTPFSDGAFTIDELCEAHLELETVRVAGIGICDHLFRTPSSLEPRDAREFEKLFAAEARQYFAYVAEARQRWQGRMEILCGCEINWPLNAPFLDSIRGMAGQLDYVLFEYIDWAGLTALANQARRWPCAVGLAHTDAERQFPSTPTEQVIRTMANARIFYEINAKFIPLERHERWFSILPLHKVAVSIGTDTHDDLESVAQLAALDGFARGRGLDAKYLEPARVREARAALISA